MIDEYLKAQKLAEREYKSRLIKGGYPFLPALDDIFPDADRCVQRKLGLLEIPVSLIVGTKTRARQNSFAPNFMPLLKPDSEFAIKWSNLYRAQLDEGFTHAIKVYEYLHRFYVLEGNKRVSVSRYLDMPTIMAEVIRVVPGNDVLEANPAYSEFMDFYRVAPIYDIECKKPGSYREIAKLLGRSMETDAEPWPKDVVKALQSSYWRFLRVVNTIHSTVSDKPMGEVFLVYLRIYIKDALADPADKEVENRLKKIRKELMTAFNIDKVALVESSDEAVRAGRKMLSPGSLISKVLPGIGSSSNKPLKAAWIYNKRPSESTWTHNHESGRLRLEQAYGGVVKTRRFISHNTAASIERAVAWGADVVFTISPTQMEDTLRAAIEHTDVKFLNCSINLAYQSVRTYYAKLYEAKFLAGIVAAIAADNHKIGYCSDYPIFGTIAGINAFAIGAQTIDPEAKIYLEWSTKQGIDWWRSLLDKGIRVISAVDSAHQVSGGDAYGVFKIEDDSSLRHLASPIWKWGKLYGIIIKTILEGTYYAKLVDRMDQATNYWWGMISGVVDIDLGDSIPLHTRRLIERLREDIIAGELNPFDWELHAQDGTVINAGGRALNSMDIITMNWLNENIIGEIPEADVLNDSAKAAVSVSGVR